MNESEQRALATQRELEELSKIVKGFADLAADARRQADELADSFARLDKLRREADIDQKVDDLDRIFGRGRYLGLRTVPARTATVHPFPQTHRARY